MPNRRSDNLADAAHPWRLDRIRPGFRPHWPAAVYALTTLLLPVGAINGQNNLLFWVFGLAIGGLVVSAIFGGTMIAAVDVEREPIAPGEVGTPIRIRYRITNRSRLMPLFAINVAEMSAPVRKRPAPTWMSFMSRPWVFLEYLAPGKSAVVEAAAPATARGEARLDGVEVWTTFPLGLSRKTMIFGRPQQALVRPARRAVKAETLMRLISGRADRMSLPGRRAGMGDEFFGLREYTPGDNPRLIAWGPSAAIDRVLVRENSVPAARRLWVGVSTFRGEHNAVERAIATAAGLLAEAVDRGFAVGLLVPGPESALPAKYGRRHLDALYDELARIDTSAGASLGADGPKTRGIDTVVVIHPESIGGGGPASARHVLAADLDAATIAERAASSAKPAPPGLGAKLREFFGIDADRADAADTADNSMTRRELSPREVRA